MHQLRYFISPVVVILEPYSGLVVSVLALLQEDHWFDPRGLLMVWYNVGVFSLCVDWFGGSQSEGSGPIYGPDDKFNFYF